MMLAAETNIDAIGHEPDNERGSFMSTYSGGKFFPLDPRAGEIFIEDIAHALSQQNRFNGHLKYPYTVAQHCVMCSKYVKSDDPKTQMFALLHDAAEAYIGDLIRPIKYYMPVFKEIEDKIMLAVFDRFEIWPTLSETSLVKTVDNLMCAAEKRDLHPTKLEWPGMPNPSFDDVPEITPWGHVYAKGAFIKRFRQLSKEL